MAKIFSILALLLAAGAAFLGFKTQPLVQELQDKGKKTYDTLVTTKATLKKTQEELEATKATLADTQKQLEDTKNKLRTTEEELTKTKADYTATKAELDAAKGALEEINKLLAELFPGTEIKQQNLKESIEKMKTSITDLTTKTKEQEMAIAKLEAEKATLIADKESLTVQTKQQSDDISKKATVIKKYTDNIMQKGLRGRVLAVNSGWGFAVISLGDKAGAAMGKVVIVARGGQSIGKLKISNVESGQSVADIIPGSFVKGSSVQPGDEVIYTGDDKVKIEEPAADAAAAAAPELPRR